MPALCLSNGRDQSQMFLCGVWCLKLWTIAFYREFAANITATFALQYGIRSIHLRYMIPMNRKQTLITSFFRIMMNSVASVDLAFIGAHFLARFCIISVFEIPVRVHNRPNVVVWMVFSVRCYWGSVEGILPYTHYNFILEGWECRR